MRKSISFLLAIFAFVAVVPTFVACEKVEEPTEEIKQEPQMTLTTNKKIGETIVLRFSKDNVPTKVIGAKKTNEEYVYMEGGLFEAGVMDVTYTLTAQTVILKSDIVRLRCWDNDLTGLDVSKCPNLTLLQCDGNQLTQLNISNNPELIILTCKDNQLTQLDVTKNAKLIYLDCARNNLTTLDVSKNTELGVFSCAINKLTSLDVSKNTGLYDIDCRYNKIKAAEMSKIINALPDWTGKSIMYPWPIATKYASISAISTDSSEENELSEADIKIAQDKNWRFE